MLSTSEISAILVVNRTRHKIWLDNNFTSSCHEFDRVQNVVLIAKSKGL